MLAAAAAAAAELVTVSLTDDADVRLAFKLFKRMGLLGMTSSPVAMADTASPDMTRPRVPVAKAALPKLISH